MKEVESVTISELNEFKDNLSAYIRYLLRVGAFKTMADMARDLGVPDGNIRQLKRGRIAKEAREMSVADNHNTTHGL